MKDRATEDTRPRLRSPAEVADYVDKGLPFIRSEILSGRLPAFVLGAEYRIADDDLERWLESKRSDGTPIQVRDGRRRGKRPGRRPNGAVAVG